MLTLRDGATVRARVAGSGPPLLLFPNMVSWPFWCEQIDVFSRCYRVIAPEYRDKVLPGSDALDTLADDVPDILAGLGYDRAALVGHSIGAMVLARMLERRPDVASAVVLANGFWRMRMLPTPLQKMQPALRRPLGALYPRLPWVARQIGSAALLWWDQHIFCHDEPRSNKQRMFFGYTMTPDTSMVLRVSAALEYNRPPDLSRATMPVLLVSGGRDRWVPARDAERLAAALPRGEHVVISDCGHMLPMVAAGSFNSTVLDFLGRAEAAGYGVL
jgi:3-oxoadipate enol-lactonase